jgi:uncharacterized protein YndB with AHSA1/START domain
MVRNFITVEVQVDAPMEKVWTCWTMTEHIVNWNFASDDWCCPSATNDLQPNGEFSYRMEAKDGSFGFDFMGTYEVVDTHRKITYKMTDGREVSIEFIIDGNLVTIKELFEAEGTNSDELQRQGWQAILHNFKKYVELVE